MDEKKDAIKDIIEKSGNTFHSKVVKFLREKGWSVLISPYYNDNITDKPREIDIIAEKAIKIEHFIENQYIGTFCERLFIECKYISKEIVFWFDNKDEEKAKNRITADTPLKYPNEINDHHYSTNKEKKVAKLFASNPDKSQDNEIIYKALNQSLNAMIYYKNTPSITSTERTTNLSPVNYPLILCNEFDKLYKTDLEKDGEYSKIEENFQLEVNYAYLNKYKSSIPDYFLIDIIDFNKLDKFLKVLDEDVALIKGRYRREV